MTVSKLVRRTVLERDNHICVRCGLYVGPFGEYSLHHRRPRGMGGSKRLDTDMPANLVLLCGSGTTGCHGYVEANRTEALSVGLLLPQSVTPADIPILTHRGWLLLDNEGCWTEAAA
jgi:hypothetical protein